MATRRPVSNSADARSGGDARPGAPGGPSSAPGAHVSIIVPTLNEACAITATLTALQAWRRRGAEIVVSDGGSDDGTAQRAGGLADRVLVGERGRAAQMNAGAEVASGAWLLFLHADTRLPASAADALRQLRADAQWGFFAVRLSGRHPLLRCVELGMNWRSRLSGVATGDQALYVRRSAFWQVGGFARIALMEDVALCTALKRRVGRPARIGAPALTSSRRWERHGIVATVLLMWRLRLAWALGADPERLARRYHRR